MISNGPDRALTGPARARTGDQNIRSQGILYIFIALSYMTILTIRLYSYHAYCLKPDFCHNAVSLY